jgi:hypothetical protein
LDLFFGGFGALWVLLGRLLEPLEALLGGLWTPKTLNTLWFFTVLGKATFWLFERLDGPLGLILALLGPNWSQNEPQNEPQRGQTSDQKMIKK